MVSPASEILRSDGPKITNFGEKFIVQTKGRWAGKPLVHEFWQRQFLNELFLRKSNGDFVYDRALLGIGRKNGKSTLSSELALYGLIGMGEASPEVYAAAAAKDQAGIVFNQSRQFVDVSPRLLDWIEPQRSVMHCKHNHGIFRVLSADGGLQMGLNPNLVVIDELHEHKKRDLWDALTTADLARQNPLVIAITTAGFDRTSVCYEQYQMGLELRKKGLAAMRREGFLFWWYEVPFQDENGDAIDYRDQSRWHQANPSSWITTERLERYQRRMPESVFRRLHLNQWTETEDAWIKPYEWDALRGRVQWDPSKDTWMGVDVGVRRDSAAIAWAQWHGNQLHIGQQVFYPEEEGPTFGVADIRGQVAKWAQTMSGLQEVAFDPWQFRESAEILQERGLPMVEFPQDGARMGPASETLYELIVDRRIVHDGDPRLRSAILSVVVAATERGGYRISKRKSIEKIDGAVALAMAADRAVTMRNETGPKNTVHIY